MKIFLLIVLICLLSAALLFARDLTDVAKREKARRHAVVAVRQGKPARAFSDCDLERYRKNRPPPPPPVRSKPRPTRPSRDLSKERAFWQKEKVKHQRELARVDARIRRLEWRLAERRSRKRPGERLRDDPTETALEQSLKSMRDERRRLVEEFLERGRKAGAFPGWLR
jgi:hypothetical protein